MYQVIGDSMKSVFNTLPEPIVNQLDSICRNPTFPWYWLDDTTYQVADSHDGIKAQSFSHQIIDEYEPVSEQTGLFESALYCIADKCDARVQDIYRVRLGLCYPDGMLHHAPHTDYDFDHTTALYYVNEAEGDTFFFDKDHKIIHRESPLKGKMIVFGGSEIHASSSPTQGIRIAMNVNFKLRIS